MTSRSAHGAAQDAAQDATQSAPQADPPQPYLVKDINAKGGVLGKKVELVVEDDDTLREAGADAFVHRKMNALETLAAIVARLEGEEVAS